MAEKIVYWEPAANTERASSSSDSFAKFKKDIEEKEEIIYYVPPQTPQEAIEQGLVGWTAVKPKNFLHHWERLGVTHKPKNWHCWWGCEGVQAVLDKDNKPTHDYYCPYWEMLMLFPDEEEDFSYTLFDRPPMPEGGPPLIEEQYNERKKQYREAIDRGNREAESNPFNVDAEQLALEHRRTGIRTKSSNKNSRKQPTRNSNRTATLSKKNPKSRDKNNDNGWSFSKPKPKQKRNRKRN